MPHYVSVPGTVDAVVLLKPGSRSRSLRGDRREIPDQINASVTSINVNQLSKRRQARIEKKARMLLKSAQKDETTV
jgi:hypothetical protein